MGERVLGELLLRVPGKTRQPEFYWNVLLPLEPTLEPERARWTQLQSSPRWPGVAYRRCPVVEVCLARLAAVWQPGLRS